MRCGGVIRSRTLAVATALSQIRYVGRHGGKEMKPCAKNDPGSRWFDGGWKCADTDSTSLQRFTVDWDKRVAAGQASAFDTSEWMAIEIYHLYRDQYESSYQEELRSELAAAKDTIAKISLLLHGDGK